MKKTQWFSPANLFCASGWLVVILLFCLALPRLCNRLASRPPPAQNANWAFVLADKKLELAVPWRDTRPLVIMAGDSHVELGNWYGLFSGDFAVRNCGLSRAKIGDVADLISAIGDHRPQKVVLLCGVNNLGGNDSVESCVADYERLIAAAEILLHPKRIVVLSVMPVCEPVFNFAKRELNHKISNFDRQLEKLCARRRVEYVDIRATVADNGGMLSPGLTGDGLHLNRSGYQKIADVLAPILARPD